MDAMLLRPRFARLADEHGAAMATVILFAAFFLVLSVMVISRGFAETDLTGSDANWDNAIQSASAAIDVAMLELDADVSFATLPANSFAGGSIDRDAIVATARQIAAADPDQVIATGSGEAVIVKMAGSDKIYGVGFAPDLSDADAVTRVIETTYGDPLWQPANALLIGGNIEIEAKKDDKDMTIVGGAYIAGNVELKEKHEENVNGCLTADSLTEKDPKDGTPYESPYIHEDCPPGMELHDYEIPEIDPMVLHKYSQYDICWGKIGAYYGPNWQQDDPGADRYLSPATGTPGTEGDPCSGSPVMWDLGIENGDDKPDEKIKFKDKKNDIEGPLEGVYFLAGRNAELKIEEGQSLNMTLITSKPLVPGNEDGHLECLGEKDYVPAIKKDAYGDVKIEVNKLGSWQPHEFGGGYTIVAGGDLEMKLKGKSKDLKMASVVGLIATHEQIKLESDDTAIDEFGNPIGGIYGTVIAEQACDTKDSKIDDGKSKLKKGDFTFNPDYYSSEFLVKDPEYIVEIYYQSEL
jgi:hypothetical protein